MATRRLPEWIRSESPAAAMSAHIRRNSYDKGLPTVCTEARCPNRAECSRNGTATFLILGDRCTRNCRFCAVRHGTPLPVDPHEPERVASAIAALELRHAVITSVTRDDLPDGGAVAFASTIHAIRNSSPSTTIEVLVPDFHGNKESIDQVIRARPEVIGHNVETVPRLYPLVRSAASYERSLAVIGHVANSGSGIVSKSGIMVGTGEGREEIVRVIHDLVKVGCLVLTIGQYLRPTRGHHPVARFVTPEEFAALRELAQAAGIQHVVSGPLVRSSYRSGDILTKFRSAVRS
ncbi:MAG: lipoyl synthase [Desulfomonile tiedjei]|nr:lipoyl synthase [Desulfomonile tiedjei]